jgi:hypothetical protein
MPVRFRPVFQAGGMEVEASRWYDLPAWRGARDVLEFCQALALLAGLPLVAVDRQVGGLSRALGRFDRLRVVPDAVRWACDEFFGAP